MEQPNLSYINELSGGDNAFKQKLINVIQNEFPGEKQVYFNNLAEKKYQLAAENVHKLKHKISILGLEQGYAVAADFENCLLSGNIPPNQKEQFQTILDNITRFLQTL